MHFQVSEKVLGTVGKAGQTKFLTLDGSEPREGGRVPSPNLEDVSPPVKARRGLHSDAVFKIWGLGRERAGEENALRTARLRGRLPGRPGSAAVAMCLGLLHCIPTLRNAMK